TGWQDTRKPRLAVHEFLKRDGARIEPMGRAPHQVKLNLAFIGPNWARDFRNLIALTDKDPLGLLTHPMVGQMSGAFMGIEGSQVDVEQAQDMVLVPVTFIENQLDQAPFSFQSVAQQQQALTTYSSDLSARAARFTRAVAQVNLYTSLLNT